VKKEKEETPNYIEGVIRRAEELRKIGDKKYKDEDWEEAGRTYVMSLQCNDKDHQTYGKLAASCLNDAVDRITSGRPGFRGLFRRAYEEASKAVEIDPSYEKGWYTMTRGYLGFRELPRAKKAAKDGLGHFPNSPELGQIVSVLNLVGVPDEVVDHESQQFKDVYQRVYEDRWIGEVQCRFCELKCMSEPRPQACPFCGCPNIEIADEEEEMLVFLTVGESYHATDDGMDASDTEQSESNDARALSLEDLLASYLPDSDDDSLSSDSETSIEDTTRALCLKNKAYDPGDREEHILLQNNDPKLTSLAIGEDDAFFPGIDDDDNDQWAMAGTCLGNHNHLKELTLGYLGGVEKYAFRMMSKGLARNRSITTLKLCTTSIFNSGYYLELLTPFLKNNTNLKHLEFASDNENNTRNIEVGPKEILMLALALTKFNSLETITMIHVENKEDHGNLWGPIPLDDEAMPRLIDALSSHQQLKTVNFTGTRLGEDGLAALDKLEGSGVNVIL